MNQSIAVVGAGICGLFTGLSLARKGFDVTLFERDVPPPEGNAEKAFSLGSAAELHNFATLMHSLA